VIGLEKLYAQELHIQSHCPAQLSTVQTEIGQVHKGKGARQECSDHDSLHKTASVILLEA
jgi:hypothetical protein